MSDVLPFGRLLYGEPNAVSNAVGYAQFYSCSHDAVIRVYDEAGNVIETHEYGGFQRIREPLVLIGDVFLLIALYSLVEIPGIAIFLAERRNMVLRCV